VPRVSPGAITTAPRGPYERTGTGAYTPRASASPGPTSAHGRRGGPKGSGFTAYVPGSMSAGRN
jgi:hypothetical protein